MAENQDADTGIKDSVLLVLVTSPAKDAEKIARTLLESELAACINIIPRINSLYRWQGKVQQDNESLMLIKCPSHSYPALQQSVLKLHPYELPEIITVSVAGGLTDYLNWVLHPDKKTNQSDVNEES